jgi:two-component system response regulator HydG
MAELDNPKGRVLLVGDEAALEDVARALHEDHYRVISKESAEQALHSVPDSVPDVCVVRFEPSAGDTGELLQRLHGLDAGLGIVVLLPRGVDGEALTTVRAAADMFLSEPVDSTQLLLSVERALETRALRLETERLRQCLRSHEGSGLGSLVGSSPAMQEIYRVAKRVAGARAPLLISGEPGTGKEELARTIHALGPHGDAPFVVVRCAAMGEGQERAAVFGAAAEREGDPRAGGAFAEARGGTLFLDEVGVMAPASQAELLRVLDDQASLDVRIIAATTRDLAGDVADGRLREDLFHRLSMVQVEIPPLRARGSDVLLLANHFLGRYAAAENTKEVQGFSEEARAKILSHPWPGNVRELEKAIARAVALSSGPLIQAEDLPIDIGSRRPTPLQVPGSTMAELERHAILATLDAVGGSTSKAAEMLGISVRTIQYRLHEYGVRKKNGGAIHGTS